MANRKRKCKHCGTFTETFITLPIGTFCDHGHAIKFAQNEQQKQREKALRKKKKEDKQKHRKDKERIKPKKSYLDQLQMLVNQWIVHVRDKDEPCCTCGTTAKHIKYDAGHWLTRKAKPELRFELTNIHKQCSVQCNQHGSGMRMEYRDFLINKYGLDHVIWLEGPHKSLKEQFPSVESIKQEMIKYRMLLREQGIKPYR